jgi:hypothetical protein
MSLYQLACAIEGWNHAQGGDDEIAPLTVEEYDRDMLAAAQKRAKMH